MRQVFEFSASGVFLERFLPLTPGGKDAKGSVAAIADRETLNALYDDTETLVRWIRSRPAGDVSLERVAWHLGRIPRIPLGAAKTYDVVELFQFKKFLSNYRGLAGILGSGRFPEFDFPEPDLVLCKELDRGGSDPETFYVADEYSPALAAVRREIAEIDRAVEEAREMSDVPVKALLGRGFEGKDFLLVPHDAAKALSVPGGNCVCEPWDDRLYVIRPVTSSSLFALLERREALGSRERGLENEVMETLSVRISDAGDFFASAVRSVTAFDLSLARARMVVEADLVRPLFGPPGSATVVKKGRHPALERSCAETGATYSPLDATLSGRVAVISGSNMGGKTVVLQTLLFLQIAAQCGFFVPAESFCAPVFADLGYAGDAGGDSLDGLSAFGRDIVRFLEAREKLARGGFVVFDEFARTTGSLEAVALMSAVTADLATMPGSRAVFATHFHGIGREEGIEFFRMKGLDREKAALTIEAGGLEKRLLGINGCMRYELEADDGTARPSDALDVALMLGLPETIAKRASALFEGMSRG